jgi:hypothetical protein
MAATMRQVPPAAAGPEAGAPGADGTGGQGEGDSGVMERGCMGWIVNQCCKCINGLWFKPVLIVVQQWGFTTRL